MAFWPRRSPETARMAAHKWNCSSCSRHANPPKPDAFVYFFFVASETLVYSCPIFFFVRLVRHVISTWRDWFGLNRRQLQPGHCSAYGAHTHRVRCATTRLLNWSPFHFAQFSAMTIGLSEAAAHNALDIWRLCDDQKKHTPTPSHTIGKNMWTNNQINVPFLRVVRELRHHCRLHNTHTNRRLHVSQLNFIVGAQFHCGYRYPIDRNVPKEMNMFSWFDFFLFCSCICSSFFAFQIKLKL